MKWLLFDSSTIQKINSITPETALRIASARNQSLISAPPIMIVQQYDRCACRTRGKGDYSKIDLQQT